MKNRVLIVVMFLLTLGTAIFIYGHAPGTSGLYPPCIFKKITGYECAGCGSARACYQLLHGNVGKAARYNILLVLFLPVMGIGFIHFFTGKLQPAWQRFNKPRVILVVITFFWVVRNLPFSPFEWLRAGNG